MQYETYDYALIEPGCTEYARKLFTRAAECFSREDSGGALLCAELDMAFIAIREGVPDRDAAQVVGEMLKELQQVFDRKKDALDRWYKDNLQEFKGENAGDFLCDVIVESLSGVVSNSADDRQRRIDEHNEKVTAEYNARMDALRQTNDYMIGTLNHLKWSKIRNRYMAQHPRETAAVKALLPKLEAEEKALFNRLDELKAAQSALDRDPEKLALNAEIEDMEARRKKLGLFRFDEKKALDAELDKKRDDYQAVLKRLEDACENMGREEIEPAKERIGRLRKDVMMLKRHLLEPPVCLEKLGCYAELTEDCDREEEIPDVDIYPPIDADIDKRGKYYAFELDEFRRCFDSALRNLEDHAEDMAQHRESVNAGLDSAIDELETNDTLGNRIGFKLRSLVDKLKGDETDETYEAYCDARKDVAKIEEKRSRQDAIETLFTYALELYEKLKALRAEIETDDAKTETCLDAVLTLLQGDLESERPFIEKLLSRCGVDFASENSAVPDVVWKVSPDSADDLPLDFPKCFERSYRTRRKTEPRQEEHLPLRPDPFRFALSGDVFQKAATWKEKKAEDAERQRMLEAGRKR